MIKDVILQNWTVISVQMIFDAVCVECGFVCVYVCSTSFKHRQQKEQMTTRPHAYICGCGCVCVCVCVCVCGGDVGLPTGVSCEYLCADAAHVHLPEPPGAVGARRAAEHLADQP